MADWYRDYNNFYEGKSNIADTMASFEATSGDFSSYKSSSTYKNNATSFYEYLTLQKTSESSTPVNTSYMDRTSQSLRSLDSTAKEFLDQVELAAALKPIQTFYTLYIGPWEKSDTANRLGVVTGSAPAYTINGQTDDNGRIYTRALFDLEYNLDRNGSKLPQHYTVLWFPPYNIGTYTRVVLDYSSTGALSNEGQFTTMDEYLAELYKTKEEQAKLLASTTGEDISSIDVEDSRLINKDLSTEDNNYYYDTFEIYQNDDTSKPSYLAARSSFTYREPGFKSINDNIGYWQYIMELCTGIVSSYLTEWDISMYLQEGILNDTNGATTSVLYLTHRLQDDNPSGYGDDSATVWGVMNCAVSCVKGDNERSWILNKYPYSRYLVLPPNPWRTSGCLDYPGTEDNMPEEGAIAVPNWYRYGIQGYTYYIEQSEGNDTLYNRIKFYDLQGAALSGWDGWDFNSSTTSYNDAEGTMTSEHQGVWKALYTTSDDSLTDVDIEYNSTETGLWKIGDIINQVEYDCYGIYNDGCTSYGDDLAFDEDSVWYDSNDVAQSSGGNKWCPSNVFKGALTFLNMFKKKSSSKSSAQSQADYYASQYSYESILNTTVGNTYTSAGTTNTSGELAGVDSLLTNGCTTVGVAFYNPVMYGGPHGYYKSPHSIASYFEENNLFLRNIPRAHYQAGENPWSHCRGTCGSTCTNYFQGNERFFSQIGLTTAVKEVQTITGYKHATLPKTCPHPIYTVTTPAYTPNHDIQERSWSMSQDFLLRGDNIDNKYFAKFESGNFSEMTEYHQTSKVTYKGYYTNKCACGKCYSYTYTRTVTKTVSAAGLNYYRWSTNTDGDKDNDDYYRWGNWIGGPLYIIRSDDGKNPTHVFRVKETASDYYYTTHKHRHWIFKKKCKTYYYYMYIKIGSTDIWYPWADSTNFLMKNTSNVDYCYDYSIHKDGNVPDHSNTIGYNAFSTKRTSCKCTQGVFDTLCKNFNCLGMFSVWPSMTGSHKNTANISESKVFGNLTKSDFPVYGTSNAKKYSSSSIDKVTPPYSWWPSLFTNLGMRGTFYLQHVNGPFCRTDTENSDTESWYLDRSDSSGPNGDGGSMYFASFACVPRTLYVQLSDTLAGLNMLKDSLCGKTNGNWNISFDSIQKSIEGSNYSTSYIPPRAFALSDPDAATIENDGSKLEENLGYNYFLALARMYFCNGSYNDTNQNNLLNAINSRISTVEGYLSTAKKYAFLTESEYSISIIKDIYTLLKNCYNLKAKPQTFTIKRSTTAKLTGGCVGTIESVIPAYLNVLYESRKFFIARRCNKQNGTLFWCREFEKMIPQAISQQQGSMNDPHVYSHIGKEYSVDFLKYTNTFADKSQVLQSMVDNDDVEGLDTDRISYVFIRVSYTTEDAYNKYCEEIKNGSKTEMDEGVIKVQPWTYIKKKDGTYKHKDNGDTINEERGESWNASGWAIKTESEPKYAIKPESTVYGLYSQETNKNFRNIQKKMSNTDTTINVLDYDQYYDLLDDSNDFKFLPGWYIDWTKLDILYNLFVGVNSNAIRAANIDDAQVDPQQILCAASEKGDYWVIPVGGILPRAEGYINNVKLRVVPSYSEDGLTEVDSVDVALSGLSAYALWPIIEEQEETMPKNAF